LSTLVPFIPIVFFIQREWFNLNIQPFTMQSKPAVALLIYFTALLATSVLAQDDLPQDYLTKEFHKGRRDAARQLMPPNSVMVVFAAPKRNFSNDVDYFYHQNPDLYYFTGYKEPNSVLLIFKEDQTSGDGKKFNELFFVQKRNPLAEQWTGRRLGTEGVIKKLGIQNTFNGEEFKNFQLDASKFTAVIFGGIPEGLVDEPGDPADMYDLFNQFRQKIQLPIDYNNRLNKDLSSFVQRPPLRILTGSSIHIKQKWWQTHPIEIMTL